MKAMVLHAPGPIQTRPLHWEEGADPEPGAQQLVVRVDTCGVCRTDLHVVEGDLPPRREHVVPGHEVVGTVVRAGPGVRSVAVGERVGVPWLHQTCGRCEYCRTGRENLCDAKQFTGYSTDGGYATHVVAEDGFTLPLGTGDARHLAPFLCAGIIGYRALKVALPRPGGSVGFFGFGGSAHLTLQLAARMGFETLAYSRNPHHLDLARKLGAAETILTNGTEPAPERPRLDSAVVFAPTGEVVLEALKRLKKGGTLSIAAIHMTPVPSIDYDRYLFGERKVVSVESNTRADAREFLDLANRLHLESTVTVRPLREANEALQELKAGRVDGAVVLDCASA